MALLRPYRRTHWPCCRPCRALCRAPCHRPPVTIQSLYRNTSPCRAHCAPCRVRYRVCRNAPAPCCRALLRRITTPGALCCDARPPSCHDTNDCIVTHLSGQAERKSTVLAVSQGYVEALLRRVMACHCAPLCSLCHDTVCCIVTQHHYMGSSPFQPPLRKFFFSLIFFSFVPAIVRP